MPWKFDLKSCGVVTGSHTAAVTSITVGTGEGARFEGSPRKLVIYEASYYDDPAEAVALGKGEIAIQTLQSGDVLTVQRAKDGTTALDMTDTGKIWFICNFLDVQMSGDLFNVKTFGAVGDGAVDDTAAVHDAITSAGNFGSVYFPSGTYDLATWPDAGRDYGPRTLFGELGSTVQGPATALFVDVSSDLHVHDLGFTDWLKVFEFDPIGSTDIGGVSIERCEFNAVDRALGWTSPGSGVIDHFRIKDCLFDTLTEFAIRLYGIWNHMEVSGCRIETTVDGAIALGRSVAADEGDWRNTHVTNNSISGLTTTTASVRAIDVFGKKVIVTGNNIEDVSGATADTIGIHCESESAVISNNTILNIDGSAGNRGLAIRVLGNDFAGGSSSAPDGFNVVIDGNVIDMGDTVDSRGIRLENDNIVCSNNVITGVRDIGIGVVGGASRTYSNILIQGNRIDIATAGTPGYGVYYTAGGNGYHTKCNVITGAVTGIVYQPGAGTPTDYTIVGNTVSATTSGFRLQTSVLVTGVLILGNHFTGSTTGLSMETTSADLVQIAFNTFSGVTTDFALSALPTNLNWLEQNGDTLELHGKLDIITGGLTVTAGGITVIAGTVTLEGGNEIHNASGAPAAGLGAIGDLYLRNDGSTGTVLYVKEGASTWAAK